MTQVYIVSRHDDSGITSVGVFNSEQDAEVYREEQGFLSVIYGQSAKFTCARCTYFQ